MPSTSESFVDQPPEGADAQASRSEVSPFEEPSPKEAHAGWHHLDKRKVVVAGFAFMALLALVLWTTMQSSRSSTKASDSAAAAAPGASSQIVRPAGAQATEELLDALTSAARDAGPQQQKALDEQSFSASALSSVDSLQRMLRQRLGTLRATQGTLPGRGRYRALLRGEPSQAGPARRAPGVESSSFYPSTATRTSSRTTAESAPGVTAKPVIYEAEAMSDPASRRASPPVSPPPASWRPAARGPLGSSATAVRDVVSRSIGAGAVRGGGAAGRSTAALGSGRAASTPLRSMPPASPFVLRTGTVIPAIIETGVTSDLPGYVRARVTRDIFDSATQQHLLIPKGSVLQGRYEARVRAGQNRVAIVWDRLILPDGSRVALPSFEVKGGKGRTGVPGEVDNHFWRIFGGALLSGLVGAGIRLATYDQEASLFSRPSPTAVAGQAAAQQVGKAADQMLRRQMNIEPTIKLDPGTPVMVYVSRRITFAHPYRPADGFSPAG